MRKNANVFRAGVFALALFCFLGCVQQPRAELSEPRVSEFTREVEPHAVELSARLEPAGHVKTAGFYVWKEATDRTRHEVRIEENRIHFRCSGLEAATDYQAAVFWSNGREERVSEPVSFTTLPQPEDPVLWKYVLEHYDGNGDGEMAEEELSQIKELVLSDLPLASQAGLEKLTELESLSMGANGLKRIDLSANKRLRTFSGGRDAGWEELVLDNPVLIQLYFLGDAGLRKLDLTRCPMLYICEWWDIPLEEVDFSANEDLYVLRFSGTKLKELDLSANFRLRHLNSVDNPDLKTVWLRKGQILESCEVEDHTEIRYK